MKKWILYETRNLINGRIYVGVHRGTNGDGYLGSGKALKHAIKLYGNRSFERRDLASFEDESAAYESEQFIVNERFCKCEDTYNVALGGNGGWEGRRITQPGESNPHAKLTWELVAQIRASDKGPTELAKEYNVAKSQISLSLIHI